jgi:hypothetical protein
VGGAIGRTAAVPNRRRVGHGLFHHLPIGIVLIGHNNITGYAIDLGIIGDGLEQLPQPVIEFVERVRTTAVELLRTE